MAAGTGKLPYNHRPMRRLIPSFATIVLAATAGVAADAQPTTIREFYDTTAGTRVIAHRGFSAAAPENTLAAIEAAIRIGADMVEIDVTLSADGHVIVIHDETLDRTTDGSGEVARLTLSELEGLDAGSWFDPRFAGERIPTLDEVVALVRNRILLNVEIKSEAVGRGIAGKVVAAIREHEMTDQVIVSSFSPEALRKMRALAPEIRTAVLYNTEHHRGRDVVEIVADLGASAFNIKRQRLTRRMHRRCREHGIPVGIYTVNEPRRMRRMVARSVDAIFTDHPDLLLAVLEDAPAATPVPAPVTP
jgi:glycerophosphoryl diester phosphodiesterase